MTAMSAHQGKGKGQENWYSCAPLWVCVTHHDFHSLCVCAPGYSIISFSCCISPSCVAIRVHCRIPICPHMAQTLLISLLNFFSRTRGFHNSQLSVVSAWKTLFWTYQGLRCYLPLISCTYSLSEKPTSSMAKSFTKHSAFWCYTSSAEKPQLSMSEFERLWFHSLW